MLKVILIYFFTMRFGGVLVSGNLRSRSASTINIIVIKW
jgi:hypothetical protein